MWLEMFTSAFSSGELKKFKSEIMKILIRGGGGGGGWSDTYPVTSVSLIKFLVFFMGWGVHVQLSYDFSFTMFTDEII